MAVEIPSCDPSDDDYIDMEVGSYTNFLCHAKSSPRQSREFEFQMSLNSWGREPTTSPADELFYKGKLLPLHHPPRLQMVEKLLQKSTSDFDYRKDTFEEFYGTPLITSVNTPTATSTPFQSCNISPSESCRISRELNPDEYLLEYAEDASYSNCDSSKKSWTKKLKHSSLCLKLKASTAYIKSLFSKSGCSDESCATADKFRALSRIRTKKKAIRKTVVATEDHSQWQLRDNQISNHHLLHHYIPLPLRVQTARAGI